MNDKLITANSSPAGDPNGHFFLPLLDRYLAGECSLEESGEIERLIAQDGRVRAAYNDLVDIRAIVTTKPKWNSQAMLSDLHSDLGLKIPAQLKNTNRVMDSEHIQTHVPQAPVSNRKSRYRDRLHSSWIRGTWIGALSLALAIGIFAVSTNSGNSAPETDDTTIVSTALGQRASTQLPDGSRITLAPGSTLRYDGKYNKKSREVILDGEAYFDVAANADRPFVIVAGTSRTVVLGTTFSVRRYTTDSVTKVVVATGRVSVGSKVLSSGEIARVADDGQIQVSHTQNPELLLGWTRDTLAFERTTAAEMLNTLGRWYGVEFELLSSELLEQRYSGTFAGISLDEAVRLVSTLMNVQPNYEGSKIVLR